MNFIKKTLFSKRLKKLLISAEKNLLNKNFHSANDELTKAIKIDAQNVNALFNRGIVNYELKKYELAKKDFEKILSKNPDFNDELNNYLAKINSHLGNLEEYSNFAEKYYENNQTNFDAIYSLARAKYFNKEYNHALKLTNELCNKYPEDFNIRYLRSLISYHSKNYLDAIVDIEKAIEISPLFDFSFNLRGLINISLFNYKEALDDFDYAIKLNPNIVIYYFNKAKMQYKIGDLIDAHKTLTKALSLDEENMDVRILRAEINVLAENFTEALEDYQKVFPQISDKIRVLKRIAEIKFYNFDFEGAENDLIECLKIDKNNCEILLYLANINVKLNKNDIAMDYLKKALEINIEFKPALLHKGLLELYLKKYEDSVNSFSQLLILDPLNKRVRMYKAKAELLYNKIDEAAKTISGFDYEIKDKDFYLVKSKINFRKNNLEEAEKNLSSAINIGNIDSSADLLNNVLSFKAGKKLDGVLHLIENNESIEDINELILNGLIYFENENYEKSRTLLQQVVELDESKKDLINPFLEYFKN